jgi:hypothetical protein
MCQAPQHELKSCGSHLEPLSPQSTHNNMNVEVTAQKTSTQEWNKLWDESESHGVTIPLTFVLQVDEHDTESFPVDAGKSSWPNSANFFSLSCFPPAAFRDFGKSLSNNNAAKVRDIIGLAIKLAIRKK